MIDFLCLSNLFFETIIKNDYILKFCLVSISDLDLIKGGKYFLSVNRKDKQKRGKYFVQGCTLVISIIAIEDMAYKYDNLHFFHIRKYVASAENKSNDVAVFQEGSIQTAEVFGVVLNVEDIVGMLCSNSKLWSMPIWWLKLLSENYVDTNIDNSGLCLLKFGSIKFKYNFNKLNKVRQFVEIPKIRYEHDVIVDLEKDERRSVDLMEVLNLDVFLQDVKSIRLGRPQLFFKMRQIRSSIISVRFYSFDLFTSTKNVVYKLGLDHIRYQKVVNYFLHVAIKPFLIGYSVELEVEGKEKEYYVGCMSLFFLMGIISSFRLIHFAKFEAKKRM